MSYNKDYIPGTDEGFNVFQRNLLEYIPLNRVGWDLPAGAFTELQPLQTAWSTAYAVATNPATRTKSAIAEKNASRKAYVAAIRRDIKAYITYNPKVTNADRDNMALPIHDSTPSPTPPPDRQPAVEIDFSKHQQHAVIVKDIIGKTRPDYAHGFEVWYRIGEMAPTADADFRYAGFSSRSPFVKPFDLSDVGKNVYYRAHWVNAKNKPGPWSDVVSAIIA